MKIVDRRRPLQWRTPRRKPFTPSGVTLGASVALKDAPSVAGQIWSQAPTRTSGRYWWVVSSDGVPHECWERDLVVLGQCIDTSLPLSNVA